MSSALLLTLVLAQNYQGYPVAPRSTGMGGAAVAMGAGAGNSFYNPGAIAWSSQMTGDVSGNLFAASLTDSSSTFGTKSVQPAFGFQIIPSNMSFEWRGMSLGPIHLSEKWGLGVSVVAPFDVQLDGLASAPNAKAFASLSSLERVYAIYNSIGYRVTDEFGIGLSVVAMYRQASGTMMIDTLDETTGRFTVVDLQQTRKSVSHGLGVGLQWRPSNGLRAGLAIRLPVTSVFGFGNDVGRLTVLDTTNNVSGRIALDRQVEPHYERPWRFSGGLAYEKPSQFAVAADVTGYTGLEYISEIDAKTGQTLEVTKLLPVVNVAVGGEVFIGATALRAGFFTDHSPYPAGLSNAGTPRINRYGGTISLTLERKLYRTEVGLLFSGGHFESTTLDVVGGSLAPITASGTEYRLVATYSSTLKL